MQKRNRAQNVMAGERTGAARSGGLRPGTESVIALVDTTDPAWPGIVAVLQEFKAAGIELDKSSIPIAVKLGRRRPVIVPEPDAGGPVQVSLVSSAASIVYYIRRSDLIKIGTTKDPRTRFRNLFPDEILAVEPGDRKLEEARHRQFRHLRVDGEHFRDEPELRLHAFEVCATYGDPDPSWPTSGRKKWRPADPSAIETMTAAEAETELGIRNGTLRVWVHRGLLKPVGHGERQRAYYRKDHLIALRDSPKTRMRQPL